MINAAINGSANQRFADHRLLQNVIEKVKVI